MSVLYHLAIQASKVAKILCNKNIIYAFTTSVIDDLACKFSTNRLLLNVFENTLLDLDNVFLNVYGIRLFLHRISVTNVDISFN